MCSNRKHAPDMCTKIQLWAGHMPACRDVFMPHMADTHTGSKASPLLPRPSPGSPKIFRVLNDHGIVERATKKVPTRAQPAAPACTQVPPRPFKERWTSSCLQVYADFVNCRTEMDLTYAE